MRVATFLIVVCAAVVLLAIGIKPPPDNAHARGEPWDRSSMETQFFSGAVTETTVVVNPSSVWRTVVSVGSAAADTVYIAVHDKSADAWVELRTLHTKLGSSVPLALDYYAPQIDSVRYSATASTVWARLEVFY